MGRRTLAAILNLHEPIENKLFLDRTRKDSNFKFPNVFATLFQIEKCWDVGVRTKAVNILRTRMATASPINAPNELTAKSAQSACRPGEKV